VKTRNVLCITLGAGVLVAGFPAAGGVPAQAPAPGHGAGTLVVRFFYEAPRSVHPTYHTAIWLEDKAGKLVRTLYVSQELSDREYKLGTVCPDWVKQVKWDQAPAEEVAAVTAPTPVLGEGELAFDLAKLGVPPGTYGFRFQMHVEEDYNVLYRGDVRVGGPSADVALETVTGPGRPSTTDQFVRDLTVRYVAAGK
jgi:hypothetical protein